MSVFYSILFRLYASKHTRKNSNAYHLQLQSDTNLAATVLFIAKQLFVAMRCLNAFKYCDLLAVRWWWADSRRIPRKTGTEIQEKEMSFHGSRCRGLRGTPDTSPRWSRKKPKHLVCPVRTGSHLSGNTRHT